MKSKGLVNAKVHAVWDHFPGLLLYAKGLVIDYGEGGATKWENSGCETFCAPPPLR